MSVEKAFLKLDLRSLEHFDQLGPKWLRSVVLSLVGNICLDGAPCRCAHAELPYCHLNDQSPKGRAARASDVAGKGKLAEAAFFANYSRINH